MRPFRTAPNPYQDRRRNLPAEIRTLPWAQITAQNWPVYPAGLMDALVAPRANQIAPNTFFLPIAAQNHPYTGALGAVQAVMSAQADLARIQHLALNKYVNGQALTNKEAAAVLALRMPAPSDVVSWDAAKRARCPDVPAARQIPFHPRYQPPSGVMRIMQAVATGNYFNPATLLSTATSRSQAEANALRAAVLSRAGPVYAAAAPTAIKRLVPVTMVAAEAPASTASRLAAWSQARRQTTADYVRGR